MAEKPSIGIDRFEVATAADGDVLLTFIGAHRLPDPALLRVAGADVVAERGGLPSLVFRGVAPEDLRRLAAAPRVLVNRCFSPDEFEVVEARLVP